MTDRAAGQPACAGMLTDLTDRERKLIAAVRRGDWLVCSDLAPDELGDTTRPDHLIRGQVLRELLLGRHGDLDPHGVRLGKARITGEVDLNHVNAVVGLKLAGCVLDEPAQLGDGRLPWVNFGGTHVPGLMADRLRTDGPASFQNGFTATGAVSLRDARIGGDLDMSGAHLTNTNGPALNAEGLQTDGPALLREGFTATGAGNLGAVRLFSAHIGGALVMEGAHLTNTNGPALNAERLRTDGPALLRKGFTATGAGNSGAVRLFNAHIGGTLSMYGAHLTNTDGPALNAEGLQTDGPVLLREGFTATGAGNLGAVRLFNAHIGGALEMDDAHLTNTDGPALNAEGLQTDGSTLLRKGFTATGAGNLGAVRLFNAHIGGTLSMEGAQLGNLRPDLLLDLENVRCSTIQMGADLVCSRARRSGKVCPDSSRLLDLDGCTYTRLTGIGWEQWLHLVRCHTRSYWPMPYQQLAAVRTAAGHDRDARHILITQQQDHRARGDIGGPARRVIHRIWGTLAGYGYRTGRTAVALLATLLLAGAMGWWAGHTPTGPDRYAAEHPTPPATTTTAPPGACSPIELIGLGIDRGLPLASTGIRNRCDLNTATPAGQWFTIAIWLLQAIVWALATLALAGYTSLVRKVR